MKKSVQRAHDAASGAGLVGSTRALQHYVDIFLECPLFLGFSTSSREVRERSFASLEYHCVLRHDARTREHGIARTASLLAWLLAIFRRESAVCLVLQIDSDSDSVDRPRYPVIRSIDQDRTLAEDIAGWERSVRRAIEAGPIDVSHLRGTLRGMSYERADLLQQVLLSWRDDTVPRDADMCADYPLQIEVLESNRAQDIAVRFDSSLVPPEYVRGVFETYRAIVSDRAVRPIERLRDLRLLTNDDAAALDRWNRTEKPYDLEHPYHVYLTNWAERRPRAVAVQSGDDVMTYRELDSYTDVLARMLSDRGVRRGDRVGQYVMRSLEMVIGLVAVHKIGAVFVPLDPQSPAARVQHILQDSGVDLVLVSRKASPRKLQDLIGSKVIAAEHLVCIDDLYTSSIPLRTYGIRVNDCAATAYLIYTSGSTGKPKGVEVTHRALVNHNLACKEIYRLTPADNVLQLASIGFDHSLEEILPTLVAGAKLVLYPDHEGIAVEQLNRVLQANSITVFMPTTALWKPWAAHSVRKGCFEFPELRVCAIGGERCPPELLTAWLSLCGDRVELQAGYGVTEAAITSTMWEPNPSTLERDVACEVPIGKAIGNTRLYVVDRHLRRLPIGAEGELCIAGEGVALGYWNRPTETQTRFLAEPARRDGSRMYRTGDIVRFTASGDLIYVTREDNQLKVNGYRVELSGIEATIAKLPGVQECAVAAYEREGQQYLCAFVRTDVGVRVAKADLKDTLPAYSRPQRIVHLDALPLNSSAKIDRQRLARDAQALHAERDREPPACDVQEVHRTHRDVRQLVTLAWIQTLGIAEIHEDDDFFEIGGSSLLAVLMLEKLNASLGRRVAVAAFLQKPTIEGTVGALLQDACCEAGCELA